MAHILVVDDDFELRSTVRLILESAEHRVSEAVNGVDGLEKVITSVKGGAEDEIEVAVIDLMMPQKDGVMMIQEALAKSPRLKIIAISGGQGGNPAWLPIAKAAGAMRIMKKPFSREQLLRNVQEVLAETWT